MLAAKPPESSVEAASKSSSSPSGVQAVRMVVLVAGLTMVAIMLSSRSSSSLTGRRVACARNAQTGSMMYSVLPPNDPPMGTLITRTRWYSRCSSSAMTVRAAYTPWLVVQTVMPPVLWPCAMHTCGSSAAWWTRGVLVVVETATAPARSGRSPLSISCS